MFQNSSTPGSRQSLSDRDKGITSTDHLEYVLSSRLAGESLANALFIADASLAQVLKETLPKKSVQTLEEARLAIARAARSGLVLLTAAKPGSEPVDKIDLLERVALAANMLKRLVPDSPKITFNKNEDEAVFARLPVGVPARLLVRVIDCFPLAKEVRIDAIRRVDRGLDVAELRFRSDVLVDTSALQPVAQLLELTGGMLLASKRTIIGQVPASWDINSDTTAGEIFLESRTPKSEVLKPQGDYPSDSTD